MRSAIDIIYFTILSLQTNMLLITKRKLKNIHLGGD